MAATSSRIYKQELKSENLDDHGEAMDVSEDHEEGEVTDDENEELAPLAEAETLLEDAAEAAKIESTKRFALIGDLSLAVPKEELSELYTTLGIDTENERHYRFNTVHMRGLAKMTTKDVYDYFSGLKPSNVEWLDKGVCNVEWDDEILPARALLYLSVEIRNLEKKYKREAGIIDSDDEGEEVIISGKSVDACELYFPIPPGQWRKGVAYEISKNIIMRYANKDDKKEIDKSERHNRYHSRHKKSKHKEIIVDDTPNDPWGSLAQTWGRGEGVERYFTPATAQKSVVDLRTALNNEKALRFVDQFLERAVIESRFKSSAVPPSMSSSSSESENSESEEDDEHFVRKRKLPRMHADREEEKQKLARLEAASRPVDLRDRLNLRKAVLTRSDTRQPPNGHSEDSGELSSDWATEGYGDLKRTLRSDKRRFDGDLSEESDFSLSGDEPGELLQIEIDNDRCKERRRRQH